MRRGLLLIAFLLAACGKQPADRTRPEAAPVVCADLVKGCRVGQVTVQTDLPPTAMQQFSLLVDAPGATEVHADLNMVEMDMGPNRYRLLPRNGRFVAAVTLPMCVSGRAEWLLSLEVDGKPLKLQFATQGKRSQPH